MKIEIEINETLFAAFVALTASGYNLADQKDHELQKLIASIQPAYFSNKAIHYFSLARTNQHPVNPYWPRGSCISAACLFIDGNNEYSTFDDYLLFLRSTWGGANEYDHNFRNWIVKLPVFLNEIESSHSYQILWSEYKNIIISRSKKYETILRQIDKHIDKFSGSSITNMDITFLPNLLQAYELADFVLQNNKLFVISTHPDELIFLHEYLHPLVCKHRHLFKKAVYQADFSIFADAHKMSSYGYLKGNSDEAKIHVLEECVVRAISFVLSNSTQSKEKQYTKWNTEMGFFLVPSVVGYSKKLYPTESNLKEFLAGSLNRHIDASR
jgi:hypothetical protein